MEKIRIVIADDDMGMRLVMKKMISHAEEYELVGEAKDGDELIALFEEKSPDVILMDIEMPGKTGIECARIIQDVNPKTILVFATAHEQYMGDAFEVYAFDYLLKPFKVERAMQTFERIVQRLREPREKSAPVRKVDTAVRSRLMLRHKDGVSFLDMDTIILIQREERSTVIYAKDGVRFVTSEALGDLEERLPEQLFFRTHKSYIVNINHIESITPYGRWTYVIQLRGTDKDALITHEKFDELQEMFA